MKFRPTTGRALLSLTAVLALALAGTALAHHGGWSGSDDPAGTVASYDSSNGALTIDLADGGSISGTVTHWTWIDCGDHHWGWHRGRSTLHGSAGPGDWGHHSHCSTDDLTAGTTVDDAVLGLRDGSATFFKIDLEEGGETGSS